MDTASNQSTRIHTGSTPDPLWIKRGWDGTRDGSVGSGRAGGGWAGRLRIGLLRD
jgi:hypothetical protein